jgi:hypothetical protein
MIAYVNPDDTTVATTMAKIKTQNVWFKTGFQIVFAYTGYSIVVGRNNSA